MIAAALRVEIERHAERMRRDNAMLRRAAAGTLVADHVARYLASVHLLVLHTPVHLEMARRSCVEAGRDRLAAHFAKKRGEEEGHDLWAESDLQRVGPLLRMRARAEAAPAMRALIDYVGAVIRDDPAHYLAYILVAEYVTVLLGPEWIHQLEARCGIPRTAMTVIDHHAELDKAHTQEAFDDLDALVEDPRALPAMRAVVAESLRLFSAFCDEVVALTDAELRSAHVHAPAA